MDKAGSSKPTETGSVDATWLPRIEGIDEIAFREALLAYGMRCVFARQERTHEQLEWQSNAFERVILELRKIVRAANSRATEALRRLNQCCQKHLSPGMRTAAMEAAMEDAELALHTATPSTQREEDHSIPLHPNHTKEGNVTDAIDWIDSFANGKASFSRTAWKTVREAALQAALSAQPDPVIGTDEHDGVRTEVRGYFEGNVLHITGLEQRDVALSANQGVEARHWREAVRSFFDHYPYGGDVPADCTREDWIEQRANELAAKEGGG